MDILSPSQKIALEQLEIFYLDPKAKTFLLAGSAGTGKTYLLREFLNQLPEFKKTLKMLDPKAVNEELFPFITATTNKALAAMEEILNGTYAGDNLTTIYSQMGLKVTNDYKTGEQKLTKTIRLTSQPNSLIVIDECSMVSRELLQYINGVFIGNSKIIYIGDPYQLPPVKEKMSPVFVKPDYKFELLEPQRQNTNSSILALANKFRDIIRKDVYPPIPNWPDLSNLDPEVIWTNDPGSFLYEIEHQFDSKQDRVLAWTNQTVRDYNAHIRQSMGIPQDLQIGERVILADSYRTNSPTYFNKLLRGDTIFRIHDILPNPEKYLEIKDYKIYILEDEKHVKTKYNVYVPNNYNNIKAAMKKAARLKDWKMYFDLKDNFADLRSIYASTVHKAQGSTFRKVFIDLNDIGKNTKWYEIARLLYVAISRASEQVIIYGSPLKRELPWQKQD